MLRALVPLLLMSACVDPAGPAADQESALSFAPRTAVEGFPVPTRSPADCAATAGVALNPPGARSLSQVASVTATVTLGRHCSADRITVELISPRGSPFEVRSADLHGAPSTTFSFPVAGSAIALRGLSGPWQLRAFADGAAVPPKSFELDR